VQDGRIGDQPIADGDKVVLYWASANRDAAEFSTPDDFCPNRESNRHLAFGAGPHRCAGSNLARLHPRVPAVIRTPVIQTLAGQTIASEYSFL
jgi:cytochrome P450